MDIIGVIRVFGAWQTDAPADNDQKGNQDYGR